MFKNYLTRGRSTGFFICIIMVVAILVAFNTDTTAGCAGDCMTCHPTLKDSKDHQSLKTCINCHNPDKPRIKMTLNFNQNGDGCGDRCFTCHNAWPQDSYHAPLGTCLHCHDK